MAENEEAKPGKHRKPGSENKGSGKPGKRRDSGNSNAGNNSNNNGKSGKDK